MRSGVYQIRKEGNGGGKALFICVPKRMKIMVNLRTHLQRHTPLPVVRLEEARGLELPREPVDQNQGVSIESC
jgi:hypothetical protein